MSRRAHLVQLLELYSPAPAEEAHLARMFELLDAPDDPFSRAHFDPGHFTASAFVVSLDRTNLALVHHQRLDRWLQPGGHIEPTDQDVAAAASREIEEEIGLAAALLAPLVFDIDVQDIVRVLEPIWETKTETASRLRGRIERVLAWATTNKHREGANPALWKDNLATILPKPSDVREVEHHPAVQAKDAASWFADVTAREGQRAVALQLLAMTCVRSENIRRMRWESIDLDARVWTIPREEMKGQKNKRKEHTVPLTDEMIEVLDGLPHMPNSDLVFPSSRGTPLSDATISSCMRAVHEAKKAKDGIGYVDRQSRRPAVPHGLRSTFRDWTAERGIDRDMAEIALAHTVGSENERAYRRTDMLERRRALMAAWVAFLKGEKVEEAAKLEECK